MAHNYILRVTAGPSYSLNAHTEIPVNAAEPTSISHPQMSISLNVRIRNYRGLPHNSPAHSPYFDHPLHASSGDQYSIALRFTPHDPSSDSRPSSSSSSSNSTLDSKTKGISAHDLQFGNDFDHPIRDRLPPGFNTALNIVKWWIDPGLEGDAYADEPYLYGPALSSFNAVHIGSGETNGSGLWFEEGGDDEGTKIREELGVPSDAKGRQKWALRNENKDKWMWEFGRTYGVDFYNPYVDFNEFALRLPGFQVGIMRYWDGQGLRHEVKRSHGLRYVLRNRSTGEVYLVVLFTLFLKGDLNEDGSLKPKALEAIKKASGGEGKKGEPLEGVTNGSDAGSFDEDKAVEEAKRKLSGVQTNDDDVD
ncbi:hypothetical protein OQA88_3014 [Cercophora sp. LCS_1]